MKFIIKKSESIVKGIFISGLICIIADLINSAISSLNLNTQSMLIFYLLVSLVAAINLVKYLAAIFLLKFSCDSIFKILKGVDILLNKKEQP